MLIGADATGEHFIESFEGGNQQNHLRPSHLRMGFDELANLIAVSSRNGYVGHHQSRPQAPQPMDRLVAVIHRYHVDALVRKGQRNDLLHRHAVIDEQNFVIHKNLRSDPTKVISTTEPIEPLHYDYANIAHCPFVLCYNPLSSLKLRFSGSSGKSAG